MMNIDKLAEREALYIKAKEMYYNEEPIMEDSAFDELEQWLKDNGSEVVKKVGSWDRKAKFPHPSKMGSLEKYRLTNQQVKHLGNYLKLGMIISNLLLVKI